MKKIVLATGCFDILHPAHLEFLALAKEQGDVLIVGLETDARVRQLKGKDRPINTWKKRAANLGQLKSVGRVVLLPAPFDQSAHHLAFLKKIKPVVLALSENTPYLEKKEKIAQKLGIKVYIFPFNPQYSTSKLIFTRKSD